MVAIVAVFSIPRNVLLLSSLDVQTQEGNFKHFLGGLTLFVHTENIFLRRVFA